MAWLPWRRTPEPEPVPITDDALCHEVRNALLGISWNNRKVARLLVEIAGVVTENRSHMKRIEETLRRRANGGNGS